MPKTAKITASSTAEYFSKNLQQVGFSSPTKAVLTTLKEALDNSLDACEEAGILPDINISVEKLGKGSLRNTDRIKIIVEDNGPGIGNDDIAKVFGEYLASSKFGRGRCSRGQQGIGISAATTWALQTTATGAKVLTKQAKQRKALSCVVAMDLKNNKGMLRDKKTVEWDKKHGTRVEFLIDGRIQLNGDAGLINYLKGNILLNPHLTLTYKLMDMKPETVERVSTQVPQVPEATSPHPHTMKLGEFISHARIFGKTPVKKWLTTGFSRLSDKTAGELITATKLGKSFGTSTVQTAKDDQIKKLYEVVQDTDLMAPSTKSVMSVGEEALALSIGRIGEVDFFSVVSRKPTICDFKPVQIEVAVARLADKTGETEDSAQVLRFANRVPLQFDKASCAIVKAITSVNWKAYGLKQPKGSLPIGPYIIAVSMVSPFIKFKNASKETIDASDELVEEIRRALMNAGQRLSRHLKREHRADQLEEKTKHIEQFGPILVETLCRILEAKDSRKEKAAKGLEKILGRDTKDAEKKLSAADQRLKEHLKKSKGRLATMEQLNEIGSDSSSSEPESEQEDLVLETEVIEKAPKSAKKAAKKAAKKTAKKAAKKTAKKAAKKTAKKAAKKTTKKAAKKTTKKAAKKTSKKAAKKTAKKKATKKKK